MNAYDKSLQSLQPNVKDIARIFLTDRNFGDNEMNRTLTIMFTLHDDRQVGYRRLRLEAYRSDYVPMMFYDTDVVVYGSEHAPIPLATKIVKQTLENVMELIDSVNILHIISIEMVKTYKEVDTLYHWHDVHDLALRSARDPTMSID
jgi:hypothetical protein